MTPTDIPDKDTIEFCKAAIAESDKQLKNDTIERCAQVALEMWEPCVAAAIRALKDKP